MIQIPRYRPRRAALPPADAGAIALLDKTQKWYAKQAWKAKQASRIADTALLASGAMVPASLVIWPAYQWVAAIFSGIVVLAAGIRRIFNWGENWNRYTKAYGQLETARQFYIYGIKPYNTEERTSRLVEFIRSVEERETQGWLKQRSSAQNARDSAEPVDMGESIVRTPTYSSP